MHKIIIRQDNAGPLETPAIVIVGTRQHRLPLNTEIEVDDAVLAALERSDRKIEHLDKPTKSKVSPAVADGNGDGGADGPGGVAGAADTPPDPLDHDGDGKRGGSLPADPPALTGKTKAELIEIAENEGVDLSKAKNNPDRIAAIEANRKAKS